ncbi:unnamed protein product [Protopolystoma xenopodis]|uniref:Uncharacterized protein n=1 Tax=Protopolystoma xenopodis TaxID=117903 RepID=A0A3S5CUR3_9PLAT|nr:unnamed protein product [Protopolystoma xenopodis]
MAIQQYRIASDMQRNSQAMFNLAYMHEHGEGFKRTLTYGSRGADSVHEATAEHRLRIYRKMKLKKIENHAVP